jgi:hypothetical protein
MANVTVSRKEGYSRSKISIDTNGLELGDIIPRVANPSSWGFNKIDSIKEEDVKRAIGHALEPAELIVIGISGDIITAYHRDWNNKYSLYMANKDSITRPIF